MSTRKVCVVVTARPSYSRIKTALRAVLDHPGLELQIVLGASALLEQYGSIIRQVEDDGFVVDAQVYMVVEGENPTSMAKTTGLGLLELPTVFDALRPDVVVTIADRYETIATAVAATYMNIPLVHVQGGEITGSIDDRVRHAVTKLADAHFVSTQHAAERVIRMGENAELVFVTGCPSIDLAAEVIDDPALDFDPFERYGGVGVPLDLSDGYLVALQHPVTDEHEFARAHVLETLYAVRDLRIPTLWFWPNVDAGADGTSSGIRAFRELEQPDNIHFFKNMAPMDFLRIVHGSLGLVGNSSVAIRECSFLGVPAVNIGTRQSGRERGANILDAGYARDEIRGAVLEQTMRGRLSSSTVYGDGKAGLRMGELLGREDLRIHKRLTY